METVAILLSVTAAAMLFVLVGRLFWILLKIALIGFLLWFLFTRVQPFKQPSETLNQGTAVALHAPG